MKVLIEYIAAKAEQLKPGQRFMLGVVGSPGAGKSTFSEKLVSELNAYFETKIACVVPMDGFHLRNDVLDERNLRELKGVPQTFDAEGFAALLSKLRKQAAEKVGCPAFDRSTDEPTADAIVVEPHHQVLIVEGNYLLLQDEPWKSAGQLMDEVWYLDVPVDTIIPRLLDRHILGGRTATAAREKMESTDLKNAYLIEKTRPFATRILQPDKQGCFFVGGGK